MRKLIRAHVSETYEITAKSLKKGDSIWVGKRVYRVASNKKNDYGQRAIRLKWGSNSKKDRAMIVVPPELVFNVHQSTRMFPQQ